MKKLLVALTAVIFLVGLAVPALADPDMGYHKVLKWDIDITPPGWVITKEASLYSEGSDDDQYRFENGGPHCCFIDYINPYPHPPVQFDIKNDLHLFPWIDADISELHLTWDIFKPGEYLAKAFIVQLKANCPVQVHLGTGTWKIPGRMLKGKLNGSIPLVDFTKDGDENAMADKLRTTGLLLDADGNVKNPGTSPDAIEVWWAWYLKQPGPKPDLHDIETGELALLSAWVTAAACNCQSIIIPDSDELHKELNTHLVFFEKLKVEPCDSEGKYVDLFAVTITPDP